jgi:hypothetical protein
MAAVSGARLGKKVRIPGWAATQTGDTNGGWCLPFIVHM